PRRPGPRVTARVTRRVPAAATASPRLRWALPGPGRRETVALTLLRQQPLGEVQALGELRHLAPHGLEVLVERLFMLGELVAQLAGVGVCALAADTLGDGLADRGDGEQEQ